MTTLSDDLHTLSNEALVYLYPMVMMNVTRLQLANMPAGRPGAGPPNRFSHMRACPTADFRAVVRPNFDTLYSLAWLDLTAGPMKLTAPYTDDRYYMLPALKGSLGVTVRLYAPHEKVLDGTWNPPPANKV